MSSEPTVSDLLLEALRPSDPMQQLHNLNTIMVDTLMPLPNRAMEGFSVQRTLREE